MDTYFPALFVPLFALPAILTYDGGDRTKFGAPSAIRHGSGVRFEFGVHGVGFPRCCWKIRKGNSLRTVGRKLIIYSSSITRFLFAFGRTPVRQTVRHFVNFFLVSELTNSNMATRWFLLKCKLESSTFYVLNGLAWIPLFLVVRVLVIPSMLQAFILARGMP